MASTIHVDIVSAESEIFSGEAEMVYASAKAGELGIAPRHTPLMTALKPGEIRLQMSDGSEKAFYVSGGMLEIQPHVVTILSDTAERAEDLDEARAEEAKRQAEEALQNRDADMDLAKAHAQLAEAAAQLQAIQRLKKRRK